jgi:hypothetical protein
VLKHRQNVDLVTVQMSNLFKAMDSGTQVIVAALLENRTLISESAKSHEEALKDTTNTLIQLLTRFEQQRSQLERIEAKVSNISANESELRSEVDNSVLQSLQYPTMGDRKAALGRPRSSTCEWIFENESFLQWLRHGNGIFWISGKTGAGKSKLMKFIYESPRTETILSEWAKPQPLSTAAFFFWTSGTLEQRSQVGFLRSLLFEILQQHRELIPVALTSIWARKYTETLDHGMALENWGLPQLLAACDILFSQEIVPIKLCLFVDGLDEYEGGRLDDVVALLMKISSSSHVKICVSSRSWEIFKDAFGRHPGLKIHDKTMFSIQVFIHESLQEIPHIKSLGVEFNREEMREYKIFEHEIALRANGVFLWATIALRMIIDGAQAGDSLMDMRRRLDFLPSDLDNIYQQSLYAIQPAYLASAQEDLMVIYAAQNTVPRTFDHDTSEVWNSSQLDVLTFTLADDHEPSLAQRTEYWTTQEIFEFCKAGVKRLRSRVGLFFEIQDTPYEPLCKANIQFIHRSAKDFLVSPDARRLSESGEHTQPYKKLLNSCILQLIHVPPTHLSCPRSQLALRALLYAQRIEEEGFDSYIPLIENLDMTMARLYHQTSLKPRGDWVTDKEWGIVDHPTNWRTNFLALCTQLGFSKFIFSKLESSKLARRKAGRPLLAYAINPHVLGSLYVPDVRTVRVLLESGVRPNEKFDEETIWQTALSWQYANHRPLVADGVRVWCRINLLLLEHGADLRATCKTTEGTRTVYEVFEHLDALYPSKSGNSGFREILERLERLGALEPPSWAERGRNLMINMFTFTDHMSFKWVDFERLNELGFLPLVVVLGAALLSWILW